MKGINLKKAVDTSSKTATEVAKFFGISRAQLYNLYKSEHIGDFYVGKAKEMGLTTAQPGTASKTAAPYYEVRATAGDIMLPDQDAVEVAAGYIDIPGLDCDYFLPVWGSSMFPDINSGDIIGVKRLENVNWIRWGEVHLIVTKEHRMVKFLRKGRDDKHVIAASKSADFDPIDIPRADIIHLYIVKAVLKRRMN